ncbi:MAG: ABC transporter permease [Planctomycetes bacterium]|nr:ABC transporter permease [Planctomycetota bacterium]
MELIRITNLHKTYHLGEVDVPVLKGVSLTIRRGEMVALMGASGSGKTTLMNILGCLDRPSSGEYWLDGEEMSRLTPNQRALVRTAKLGFVFQNFNLLPRTTALNNVLMPLDYSPQRPSLGKSQTQAGRLLGRVGLSTRLDHHPSQMSGGQQQRVAIARALVNEPALLLADEPTGNLDSHTSVEILRMFQQLNDSGITVMLVTHAPEVAEYADRVIHIVDGVIDGDTLTERGKARALAAQAAEQQATSSAAFDAGASAAHTATLATEVAPLEAAGAGLSALMPATLRTALGALRRNKMRSALTSLGIIIGIAAVIAIIEIGEGSRAAIKKSVASMGANTIIVQSGVAATGGVSFGAGSVLSLSPEDAEEIRNQCPSVVAVSPIVQVRTQVIYGNRNWVPMNIYGTTTDYLKVREWEELSEGDPFTDRDVANANRVCLIGETLARELFQGESPVGKDIRVRNVALRVIGVLSSKGANMMGMDQDDIVLAPWSTIKFRVAGKSAGNVNQSADSASAGSTSDQVNSLNNLYPPATALYTSRSASQMANTPQPIRVTSVDQIIVKAASAEVIPDAMNEMTGLLRQRHRLRPEEPSDFTLRDMAEITRFMSGTSATMSGMLLIVALISLVVGGVGIMNIMLVSVTERTREIGLRMAVGARSYHVLRQFLIEAVMLCLFGGILGVLLGRAATQVVHYFQQWPMQMSIPAIAAAFAVSVSIGIVFGFYPAWKASRLDPIEALRYE